MTPIARTRTERSGVPAGCEDACVPVEGVGAAALAPAVTVIAAVPCGRSVEVVALGLKTTETGTSSVLVPESIGVTERVVASPTVNALPQGIESILLSGVSISKRNPDLH